VIKNHSQRKRRNLFMLAIRMQRTGRKGHATYRVVVQDSQRTPTSGRVVAQIGHYDPHTKTVKIDSERAEFYLSNGAQPSERVARLIQKEGVKLPEWVKLSENKERKTRHPEKLRRDQPKEEKIEEKAEEVVEEPVVAEAPVVEEEVPADENPEDPKPTPTEDEKEA
jgi:small subunit ribosomal protein S16